MGRGASTGQAGLELSDLPSRAAEGTPVAWAYLPETRELLTGRDHHSITAQKLSTYAGYDPERVDEIIEGYYNSDEDLTSAYWEMFDAAKNWGSDHHVLWGWTGFRRYAPSQSPAPQLWSETQGNAKADLKAYGDEALAAAARCD